MKKNILNPFSKEEILIYKEFELFINYSKSSIELFESDTFVQVSKVHSELHSLKLSV